MQQYSKGVIKSKVGAERAIMGRSVLFYLFAVHQLKTILYCTYMNALKL